MLSNNALPANRAPSWVASGRGVDECAYRDLEAVREVEGHRGPMGLRLIKGFHDEALAGQWKGYRSCRLGDQWRVIYRVVADETLFQVASITAHDYRRP